MKYSMPNILVTLIVVTIFIVLHSYLVKIIWNAVVPSITKGKLTKLTLVQALLLSVLLSLIVGSCACSCVKPHKMKKH